MSNCPDRLDGFHDHCLKCRPSSDKGRHQSNLQKYGEDRRAYEYWSDGNWKKASWLMKEFNKHNLDENSKIILNKVAEFLIINTDKDLQINGHADERGTEKYNIKLSLRRAQSVYKYLVKKGVSKTRLAIHGLGESQKVSGSHEKNRRVEFIVIED